MESNAVFFDPKYCAETLLNAWRTGSQLSALPLKLQPKTLTDGYDAQDCLMVATGATRSGWKLGVGSPSQLRACGLKRPLIGQVTQSHCHTDGAIIHLPSDAPVTVECEIAFILARDIPSDAPRRVPPDGIASACVTFEIVRSRFVNRRGVGWPSFVADNVGFEALVIGKPLHTDLIHEINKTVEVQLNGVCVARALAGDDATDPITSLQALLDHAGERQITLREGDIITTGAMCKPFDTQGTGQILTASFLGHQLSFRFG